MRWYRYFKNERWCLPFICHTRRPYATKWLFSHHVTFKSDLLSLSLKWIFFFWKRVSGNAEYFSGSPKKAIRLEILRTETADTVSNFSNQMRGTDTQIHTKKKTFSHTSSTWSQGTKPTHIRCTPQLFTLLHIHIWKRLVEFGVRRYVVWVGRGRSSLEGLFRRFSQSRTCVCTCLVGFESVFKTQKKVCIFFLSLSILTPCIVTHMNVFLST